MNKRVEAIANEIKKLHMVTFDTILAIGSRIQEVGHLIEGEEFIEFCNTIHISKADCSRYVAVFEHKEIFEQFPQLKELGTAKIFALLSMIKDGKIEDFINQFGTESTFRQMKENIKSFRNGGTGEDEEKKEDAEVEALKKIIAQLEKDKQVLIEENKNLQRQARKNSNGSNKMDKKIQRKILSFIHPDNFVRFGKEVVEPMTEASKIINSLVS